MMIRSVIRQSFHSFPSSFGRSVLERQKALKKFTRIAPTYFPPFSSSLFSSPFLSFFSSLRCASISSPSSSLSRRSFGTSSFGVVFDIDGVLLRGGKPLPRAKESLQYLQSNQIPFVFLTNGGGVTERKKCLELNIAWNNEIEPAFTEDQVILSHTPMKELVEKFRKRVVVVVGSKDYVQVAKGYGLERVVTVNDFLHADPSLYPFRKYEKPSQEELKMKLDIFSEPVAAIMILHDPIDWAPEIQILSDLLLQNGNILSHSQNCKSSDPQNVKTMAKKQQIIDVYTSNPDLVFSAAYRLPRLAQGSFVEAWKAVLKKCYKQELDIVTYGKPTPKTYRYTENALSNLINLPCNRGGENEDSKSNKAPSTSSYSSSTSFPLKTIYAIGDNPKADIQGANDAKDITTKWVSILVRSGVFQGAQNDIDNPADYVVEDVGEALALIQALETS